MELGERAKDLVTGFTGTITDKAVYLGGVESLRIEASTLGSDGQPVECWFDPFRVLPLPAMPGGAGFREPIER